MYEDCLTVVFVSLASAVASEALSYFLIYRTEDYKKLKKAIDSLGKKLDKKKEAPSVEKNKQKKVTQLDEQLKNLNRDMTMAKFKSTFFVAVTLLLVLSMLNNQFDGRAVAKLPFTPLPLIRGLSHRNLPGQDFSDCSMVFLYVLCSFAFRNSLQRFLGFTPKNAGGMGGMFGEQPGQKPW